MTLLSTLAFRRFKAPGFARGESWMLLGGIALFALCYGLTARLGLSYSTLANNVTLLWPPTGLSLFVILRYGYRYWPAMVLGDLIANWGTGASLFAILGISAGNVMQTLLCAWLLQRVVGFNDRLDRVRDVLYLLSLGTACAAVSATVGPASLALDGRIEWELYRAVWLQWLMGDAIGVVVVAPFLLAWVPPPRVRPTARRVGEIVALVALLLAANEVVFGGLDLVPHGYYPAALALFPLVIWGALRFGLYGATVVTLAISMAAIWGTSVGRGPFVFASGVDSLVHWWVFANVITITSLVLAASRAERERAQLELGRERQELEARVIERTRDLQHANRDLRAEMAERRRLENEVTRVSEHEQVRIGRELHDGLGQHLTATAFQIELLERRLAVAGRPEVHEAALIGQRVADAISDTRLLARGLQPVDLEAGGLMAALGQLAENAWNLFGIQCTFKCLRPVPVHDNVLAINLYRIAQEAITNAAKHSGAERVDIRLDVDKGCLTLCISDNGHGLDTGRASNQDGMGLHIMRCRAHLIGAELTLSQGPDGGLEVCVTAGGITGKDAHDA